LSLIIILIGVYNLWLAGDQALHAGTYRDLDVSYPPLLRAACALIWGIAFTGIGIRLARRQRWARRAGLILACNYGVFNVLWLSVYAESDYSRDRIAFQAALTASLIGIAAWILFTTQNEPQRRRDFLNGTGELTDDQPQD
jgi:predicted outer membrane lipoprotein